MRSLLVLLLALLCCACSTQDEEGGTGVIYVSNQGSNSLARFSRATTAQGDVLPQVSLRGQLTRLNSPGFLTYDPLADRMIVPNGDNSILFFDGIHGLAENAPPLRFLSGLSSQLNRPTQVVLDLRQDLLYVANSGGGNVLVFANASSLQGSVAPIRVLSGPATRLSSVASIALDSENDRLWVADSTANAILVYEGASSLNGAVPPSRVISGNNTRLSSPGFLLLDGQHLWVSCNQSILRFQGSVDLQGDVAPVASISGSATGLVRPAQLRRRADNDELYVADTGASALLVFERSSSANGAPPPRRRIFGVRPGLTQVTGLVLDLDRN